MKQDIRLEICTSLGVRAESNHGSYLELPNVIGQNRNEVFGFFKDKL